jgi:hypothetical protein
MIKESEESASDLGAKKQIDPSTLVINFLKNHCNHTCQCRRVSEKLPTHPNITSNVHILEEKKYRLLGLELWYKSPFSCSEHMV